ncbi:MAG: tetratricopeptide repeat protein, partial [Pseudomonadota bacterium]
MSENARQACLDVLANDPSNARALHVLGVIEIDGGNAREGIELIERSIRIEPTSHAYNDLGQTWAQMNVMDLAGRSFLKAIQIDESNAHAHNNLGRLAEMEGNLGTA